MPKAKVDDQEFMLIWENSKSVAEVSRKIEVDVRAIHRRRRRIESKYCITLPSIGGEEIVSYPDVIKTLYYDRPVTAIVFTDCHFWPGYYTPAFWILLQIIQYIKPDILICNGDAVDGYRSSLHSRIGWDKGPTAAEEIYAVQSNMDMIRAVTDAELYWNWGNHDIRFDTRLASKVPEMENVKGMALQDHFPHWQFNWGLMINDSLMIKHRWKGGAHAGFNNAKDSGISTATGHTHRLNARPYTNYVKTIFGIECGTLSDPHGPQYLYTEGNPVDWQSGFSVINIDQESIRPESVHVMDGKALFRGIEWVA